MQLKYKQIVRCLIYGFLFNSFISVVQGVVIDLNNPKIKQLIQEYKTDPRGPYQAIKWFCPDGSILPANQRCPQPGGIQHALPKETAQQLAQQGIYLGQILAGTDNAAFWDAENQNARMIQYQLEHYLQQVDNGWIVRKARFYRGAIQVEDEETWGIQYLEWLLSQNDLITKQYFLIRQAARDIPHQNPDNRIQEIRTLAKTLTDSVPSFMDIRIKIHGQPDITDCDRVSNFIKQQAPFLSESNRTKFNTLERMLKESYNQSSGQVLFTLLSEIRSESPIKSQLQSLILKLNAVSQLNEKPTILSEISELLLNIRLEILNEMSPDNRLALLDISLYLEDLLFQHSQAYHPSNLLDLLSKGYTLCQAAAGCGYIEIWEWEQISENLKISETTVSLKASRLRELSDDTRRIVDWGTGMFKSVYKPTIDVFSKFEPLSTGFLDEKNRSTILLPLGEVASQLSRNSRRFLKSYIMGLDNAGQSMGLNPGYAIGILRVIADSPENVQFSSKEIYVIDRPPADLKPIAGIATVTEGNVVSHVQLLARNLAIPNAVITRKQLEGLVPYAGEKIFYAVSPRGSVVMKPVSEMTSEEKKLFTKQTRHLEKVTVPTNTIDLTDRIRLLSKTKSSDSGLICGPKAANLGQLKLLFPQMVGEGLIIPFGSFYAHMQQIIPGSTTTYWDQLQIIFRNAAVERKQGAPQDVIEQKVIQELAQYQTLIQNMPFLPDFLPQLRTLFPRHLGAQLGQLPVFIRSDTNMEDLKDFTGAGLNLTVFNVVTEQKILQSIRDVWASPYSERSYLWRQKFLNNPEMVFPSILILPSVNVEKSGVMITTGLQSFNKDETTIAFNRGVGGAVEGQLSESYLLLPNRQQKLLSVTRESQYTGLPVTGGTTKIRAFFNESILTPAELGQLHELAVILRLVLPRSPALGNQGPYDIELGFFHGKLVLFQARPFVENHLAQKSVYLRSLDKLDDGDKIMNLGTSLLQNE